MRKLLLSLILFPSLCFGQNQASAVVPAWWKAALKLTTSGTVQLVRASVNATTGSVSYVAIAGQTQPMPVLLFPLTTDLPKQLYDLQFPGQASPMNVAGVKVSGVCIGGGLASCTFMFVLPINYVAAAGKKVYLHYDASSLTDDASLQLLDAPFKPVQVVTGPITPAPAPAPTPTPTGASLPGDSSPPLSQLTDSTGAVWTITQPGAVVKRNGVNMGNPYGDAARLYVSGSGGMRAESPTHGYICAPVTGTAWTGSC